MMGYVGMTTEENKLHQAGLELLQELGLGCADACVLAWDNGTEQKLVVRLSKRVYRDFSLRVPPEFHGFPVVAEKMSKIKPL